MQRDETLARQLPDPVRVAVGLDVGDDGEYFVGSDADFGQNHTIDIVNYNSPPSTQPGLWCQWVPNEDGTKIEWDGGEKFYHYVEWLQYLVSNFIGPWGYKLNGVVRWEGEDPDDVGTIVVDNNVVKSHNVWL